MSTLKQLTSKFDWVNSGITEKNFPIVEVSSYTKYKLFHFDKYISSENAIKEMEKEGYRASNISELLSWPDWNEKEWVAALGSVGEVFGGRFVPFLDRSGSERRLYLGWFGDDWDASCRFLGVRNPSLGNSDTQKSALGHLESLTLENMFSNMVRIEQKVDKLLNHLGIGK